jgi:hypothetical protein
LQSISCRFEEEGHKELHGANCAELFGIQEAESFPVIADNLSRGRLEFGAVSQRLILAGERCGLQTRTATTESVSLCMRMKN